MLLNVEHLVKERLKIFYNHNKVTISAIKLEVIISLLTTLNYKQTIKDLRADLAVFIITLTIVNLGISAVEVVQIYMLIQVRVISNITKVI